MRLTLLFLLMLPFVGYSQFMADHFVNKNKTIKEKHAPDTRSTEIGVFGGVAYYNGETNPAAQFPIALMDYSLGVLLRRNINSRWAFRLNGFYGGVKGNDLLGSTNSQASRGVAFQSKIYEVSGQFEFNFFPYCVANDEMYFTPYIFAGLGGFRFNPTSSQDGGGQQLAGLQTEGKKYSKVAVVMPFGVGVKPKLSNRFLLGIEWGMRKTWTDYLDDVSTVYVNSGKQRGNSKNKDFYSFAGVSLTMRLGPKITTCHFQ